MGSSELPIVLRASAWRSWAGAAFFAFCSVAAVGSGLHHVVDWLVFVGSTAFALAGLLFAVRRPSIEVTETTVKVRGPLKPRTFELRHCGPFRAWHSGRQAFVSFRYEGARSRRKHARVAKTFGTDNAAFPIYDYDAAEVVALLNAVRADALRDGDQ